MKDISLNDLIEKLMKDSGLGKMTESIQAVSGGFLHRMYKVETDSGVYAVKHLNAEIMKRPTARRNYARAEKLEAILEKNSIPIVPALSFDGKKMQEIEGEYFYIFKWQKGQITDWNHITKEQCYQAGNILGRIHAIEPREIEKEEPEVSRIDWQGYLGQAKDQNSEISSLLDENMDLLIWAESEMNKARAVLPAVSCISNEDMDPKNIMWEENKPWVIDLECLDYGNPASHVMQLALQWSGITTCELDTDKMLAFFEGYFAAYQSSFCDYEEIFGVAYTWVEWLEYNIRRALGNCVDEAEREMGISQVKSTIQRIKHVKEKEPEIKAALGQLFKRS